MNQNPKIIKHIQSLKALSASMEDYLFLVDLQKDTIWFFGNLDEEFAFRQPGQEESPTQQFLSIVHPRDKAMLLKDYNDIRADKKDSMNLNYRLVDRSGKSVWINCRGSIIQDEGVSIALIGRVSRGIFASKISSITGMFNKRKMLEDSLKNHYMNQNGYLLLLGLDRLSMSYSEYGREYMENILVTCAKILEEMVMDDLGVYHVEEGVFAVSFIGYTRNEVQGFYEEVTKRMRNHRTITAVALPSSKQYFSGEHELYETAMAELVKAKKERRSKLTFYSRKAINEQINERALKEALERAVNNNFKGFYICYQPQIRGGDYSIDGVEALMRFRANGVEYSPSQFIPVMEQSGLINEAGIWILKQALEQVKAWREFLPELYLNVNFSLSQFASPDIIEDVIKIYKRSGLPPHVLTLELTETVRAENAEKVIAATKTWKPAGIDVALDDFGTGYSNLAMLKDIVCSEIKIERTFISHIKKDTYGYLLTSSILDFAHKNDIAVCCEGVETQEDVMHLSPLKPDLYQGYAFDKPLSVAEFEEYYINRASAGYKYRQRRARLLKAKDENRITNFDAKEILTNINVGLSVMQWDLHNQLYEMHPDEATMSLLGMKRNLTPTQYDDFWFLRIKSGYEHYVRKNLKKLKEGTEVVQFMYPWMHPEKGEVMLSFSGVVSEIRKGKVIIKCLHRMLTGVEKSGYDNSRPLQYFIENRYMEMLLSKAIAYMEVNVTRNKVQGGMRDIKGNQPQLMATNTSVFDADGDLMYDAFEKWWADKYLIKSDKDFDEVCNCDYLKACYERGETSVEMFCKCEDKDGNVYDCKKCLFITSDEIKGDIMALCVIYDTTQETQEKLELARRDAAIRSLADEYKSIMYINVDDDSIKFYREDTTLEEWKDDVGKHSELMNIFAERFVHEDNLAEYKYMQSLNVLRERLEEFGGYRFEYRRKCGDGVYRYHEVTVKRDEFAEESLCAVMAVKEIEEDVRLRLQLKEALTLAYTDHLTGLYNQQGLLNRCKELLKDKKVSAALLFMDLDNFKSVNDIYGHGMGDKVLHEVGRVIREETRGKDIVGRYGGDEFVVLIYDIQTQQDAEAAAKRIAARVNEVCRSLKLQTEVTASIGLSFTGQTGYDYHHLKEIADDRLYLAKKRGKNRIVQH